jgi:predicted transcriptional regulator
MVLPRLEEIRKKRKALDLKQREVAEGAGVSRVVINQIENRQTLKRKSKKMYTPDYDIADRIFTFLQKQEDSKMKRGKRAGEICATGLKTVSSDDTIKKAKRRMGSDGEISQLPVVDNEECVGLITSNSILDNENAEIVKDAMVGKPTIIPEDMVVTQRIKELLDDSPCILVSYKKSSKLKGIIVAWDLIQKKGKK